MHPMLWLLSCAVLACLVLHEYRLLPNGQTHAYIFDVGQGDAILLVSPSGKQVVIDGGPDMRLFEHLGSTMPFFDRTIELLVLTHPDNDHITAFPELLRRYNIDSIMLNGTLHSSGRYDELLSLLAEKRIPILLPEPDLDIDLGDGLLLDVLWPTPEIFGREPANTNNPSIVLRALNNTGSLLLTGDIEEEAETIILATGAHLNSTVMKVPHHGSNTSSSTGLLLAVQPEQALISVGRDNDFGHPHEEILHRYHSLGTKVNTTVSGGTLHIAW